MSQEIEAKILNISIDNIIKKLESLGATKEFSITYRRKVFDYTDRRLDRDNAWLRLRDEGNAVTLSFKQRQGVKHGNGGFDDDGMKELEVTVSDFDTTAEIILSTGLELKHYAENKRTRFQLGAVEVDIDEWPLIPPYLEIEAPSWEEVDQTIEQLGYTPQEKVICSAHQIYAQHGMNVNDYVYITFERQEKHAS
jgi:adenylate cyclase class 2